VSLIGRRPLTGASESSDLIYFELYKSQIPVVEQALEIAARMLGSDRSRGYCLELICADFLAGAGLHLEDEQKILLLGLRRIFHLLPSGQQRQFLTGLNQVA
jgi:hypothetical protein